MSARARGFTLIELLVALAIVAVIGVMALTGLTAVIKQQTAARERAQRWQQVQLAVRLVVQDLAQLNPRATRDETGESYEPSLLASPTAEFPLEFSRGGWANPGGFARGTVLRVAYEWEDDKLYRLHWPVMDRTLSTPPVRAEMLDGVNNVEFRFMDSAGQWQTDWPPVGSNGPQALVLRPRAVEVTIELKDFGRITRLVEVSG